MTDIEQVILSGGQTKTPKIQELVKDITGIQPLKTINPDEVNAVGAAILSALLMREPMAATADGQVSVQEQLEFTNTPLTLGIKAYDGSLLPLVPCSTLLPHSSSHTFSTGYDNQNQAQVDLFIYYGFENQRVPTLTSWCKQIGSLVIEGIPSAPRGDAVVTLFISIENKGHVTVQGSSKLLSKYVHKETNRFTTATSDNLIEEMENYDHNTVEIVHESKTTTQQKKNTKRNQNPKN